MGWLFNKKKDNQKQDKQSVSANLSPWTILSPVDGTVIPQDSIDDPEFSTGALGPGVGITPEAGRIYAPVSGELRVIFQQGHALGVVSDSGVQVLVHVGTDTVALNGIGFKKKVWEGDHVKAGDLLLEFDLALIRKFGLNDTVVVSISNAKEYQNVEVLAAYHKKIEARMPLMEIVPKSNGGQN